MTERKLAVFYDGPDYKAEGELCEGFLFIHCTVHVNSHTVLKKIRYNFEVVKEVIAERGYDKPIFAYSKNGKWCRLMGGVFHNTFEYEGEEYEVYRWEQKSQLSA